MAENRQPEFFYGYVVVVVAFLIMVILWGTYYTFGVFLGPLLAEFGWTRAMASGAFSLSLVLFGFLGIVVGRLTDRFGPRLVIAVCGLFLGLGYLLMSLVNSIWQLYLFYGVIIGVGMSGSFIPLASTVARWFAKRRGMMTGITLSGIGVGILIMPPVANWLISNYGWRSSYIVVGIIVLVLVMSAAQFLRRDPGQAGQLPYGGDGLVGKGDSQTKGFSLQEAIRTRQFWMLNGALLCFSLGLVAVMAHIVLYAVGLGVSAASAAVVLAVIGGISIPGRILMGMTGDKIGNKPVLIISFSLLSISLFWLLGAKELWMLYLFAVIFGFGLGSMSASVSPIVAEQFGLSSHGVILGGIMIGGTIGSAVGPVVAGHIFDITGSYNLAFLIYAVVVVIGLILILLLKPTRRKGGTNESERSAQLG